MRPRAVWAIFRKELTETLRDKRTLFAMIALPALVQPILMLGFGQVTAALNAKNQNVKPAIAIWGTLPTAVTQALEQKLSAKIVERRSTPPAGPEAEARSLIEHETADVVLAAPEGAAAAFEGEGSAAIELYYNPLLSSEHSGAARHRVSDVLEEVSDAALKLRLMHHGLPAHFDRPLTLTIKDVASKEQKGGDFAGRVLPMILLLMVMLGAVYPAIDTTAGEKERGTLQTLLCAPVKPIEIVAGKYLAVVLVAITSAVANLVAMGLALSRQIAAVDGKMMAFTLGPKAFVAIFAALLPAAFLLAALLLALSIFARSFREAQNYITPLMLVLLVPGFAATLPGVKLTAALALVPILNLALLVRDLLVGEMTTVMYMTVLVASSAYAAMAVLFAARVFESEQVLLGGERPWRDIFSRRATSSATLRPGSAVLFTTVLLVLVYYGSLWADPAKLGFAGGTAAVQVALLLVPALLWVKFSGAEFASTLSLRLPTRRALAGTLLLASGIFAIGALVTSAEATFLPGAQPFFDELTKTVGGAALAYPLPVAVLLIAGLPAVCEEICFRGVVMSGLSGTGSRALAIGGSALAFGLLHLSPYHILPTAILGLALGFATLESGSLLVGAIAHFANNGLAVIAERVPAVKAALELPGVIGAALLCASAGLWLLRGSRPKMSPPP